MPAGIPNNSRSCQRQDERREWSLPQSQASETGSGLATAATMYGVEQQLPTMIPIQFVVDGPRGGSSHCLGRTEVPPVFAGSFGGRPL